jgi:molybdopterin converting factor small subunit
VRVTVKLGAPLSRVVGEGRAVLPLAEGATLSDLLDALRARYPDFEAGLQGKGLRGPMKRVPYSLFVNTRPVAFDEAAATPLHDGDRIHLFVPVAGG